MSIKVDSSSYGAGELVYAVARCSRCPYWNAAVLSTDAVAAVTRSGVRHEEDIHPGSHAFRRHANRHGFKLSGNTQTP